MTASTGHRRRRPPRPPRRPSRRPARRPPAGAVRAAGHRLRVVYDIEGPRVRLGLLWFVANVAAVIAGLAALAPLYAVTSGVAGLQTARAWRLAGRSPHRLAAGGGAALLPVAAAISTAALGIAILAVVAMTWYFAFVSVNRRSTPVQDAAATLQCALFAGGAAASVVVTDRYEIGAVVALVFVVSAYETGDYLVGSGASNPLEGPLAGIAAVLVVSFGVSALRVPPFSLPEGLIFGGVAALLCPVGQLAASAVLPAADANAPALRRLDTLIVLGPVWAFAVGIYAS